LSRYMVTRRSREFGADPCRIFEVDPFAAADRARDGGKGVSA